MANDACEEIVERDSCFSLRTAMQLLRVFPWSWALESDRYFMHVRTVSSLSSCSLSFVLGVEVDLNFPCVHNITDF